MPRTEASPGPPAARVGTARDAADDVYDGAPFGYLFTDPDGLIVKVNHTFLGLTGFEADALVGRRRFSDLLTGGGRIYHETHYAPLLAMQHEVHGMALDIVCADGSRLPALVSSFLHLDEDGHPASVRVAVFDATERRQYERELLHATRRAEESERRATQLARTLQQTLLPLAPPAIPGLDVGTAFRPALDGTEVGGDFYDVFEIGVDDWVVAIGDVQGKGVDAAVVASLARHAIRAAAVQHIEPSRILATLNEVLLRDDTNRFCTVTLLRLRRLAGRWTATICGAGHPLPLLLRDAVAPTPAGETGTLLGVYATPRLHDHTLLLDPGDVILLYTDGVTEGRRRDGGRSTFFGDAGLREVAAAAHASAGALTEAVLTAVLQFQGGTPDDDIALVAIRVPPTTGSHTGVS